MQMQSKRFKQTEVVILELTRISLKRQFTMWFFENGLVKTECLQPVGVPLCSEARTVAFVNW